MMSITQGKTLQQQISQVNINMHTLNVRTYNKHVHTYVCTYVHTYVRT